MEDVYTFGAGYIGLGFSVDDNDNWYYIDQDDLTKTMYIRKSTDHGQNWTEVGNITLPQSDISNTYTRYGVFAGKNRAVFAFAVAMEYGGGVYCRVQYSFAIFNYAGYTANPDAWESVISFWHPYMFYMENVDFMHSCNGVAAAVSDDDRVCLMSETFYNIGGTGYVRPVRGLVIGSTFTNYGAFDDLPSNYTHNVRATVIATDPAYNFWAQCLVDVYTMPTTWWGLNTDWLWVFDSDFGVSSGVEVPSYTYITGPSRAYPISTGYGVINWFRKGAAMGDGTFLTITGLYEGGENTAYNNSVCAWDDAVSKTAVLRMYQPDSWENSVYLLRGHINSDLTLSFLNTYSPPVTTGYYHWLVVLLGKYYFLRKNGLSYPDNATILGFVGDPLEVEPSQVGFSLASTNPTVTGTNVVALPSQDISIAGWTGYQYQTDIYREIDEGTPSFLDFVIGDSGTYRVKLSALSTPENYNNWFVSYTYHKTGTVDRTCNLKVRLCTASSTVVEWTHTDISKTSILAVQEVTPEQMATISDFTNLYMELEAIYP